MKTSIPVSINSGFYRFRFLISGHIHWAFDKECVGIRNLLVLHVFKGWSASFCEKFVARAYELNVIDLKSGVARGRICCPGLFDFCPRVLVRCFMCEKYIVSNRVQDSNWLRSPMADLFLLRFTPKEQISTNIIAGSPKRVERLTEF